MASLRELFAELTDAAPGADADPVGLLSAHGFDLSAEDVAQALVSFAHTAPVEVAEHLQPYVAAHGPVPPEAPGAEPGDGLDGLQLLTGAPAPAVDDLDADLTADLAGAGAGTAAGADSAGAHSAAGPGLPQADPAPDLDVAFGAGSGAAPSGLPANPPSGAPLGEVPASSDPTIDAPFGGPTDEPALDLSDEPSWLSEPAAPEQPDEPDLDF